MDNPKDGTTQPASSEMSEQEAKNKLRTYKKPNGDSFQVTEEEFAQIVEIFDYFRKLRESKDTQSESLEPELAGLNAGNPVNWKVG
ncbi:MAG: hypothetical protein IPK04_14370 [Bdellovibrionales bacterium]|nr:hypothetical protein [Bdellovibrionales bacterium]